MYKLNGLPVSTILRRQARHLLRHNIPAAWEHTKGSPTIPIAQIGMGVMTTLREFKDKPPAKLLGYDFTSGTIGVAPDTGDTTANAMSTCHAALLVGEGGPAGMWGIVHDSPLLHIKYQTKAQGEGEQGDWRGNTLVYKDAVVKAIEMGARIICSNSAWDVPDANLQAAAEYAWANNALLVSSAGSGFSAYSRNTSITFSRWPAAYPNVVCVGATNNEYAMGAEAFTTDFAIDGAIKRAWTCFDGRVDVTAPSCLEIPLARQDGKYSSAANNDQGVYSNLVGLGPQQATTVIAGIAHLIVSANPALTNVQIRDILTTEVDKSDGGWAYDQFFTKVGCGYPDAERCVLRAKSMDPANAGVVFPYLRIHGRRYTSEDTFLTTPVSRYAYTELHADGTATARVQGNAGWEIGGYCSTGPITEVELWIDGVREYIGSPTSKWTGLLQRTEFRTHLNDLRVIARTATGETATRSYTTTLSTTTEPRSVSYTLAPPPVSIEVTSKTLGITAISPASIVALSQALQIQAANSQLPFSAPSALVRALSAGTARISGIRLPDGTLLSIKWWNGSAWVTAQMKLYPFS